MDAREQLQIKIIRPVIPPDPKISPQPSNDMTIANEVVALHDRMAGAEILIDRLFSVSIPIKPQKV